MIKTNNTTAKIDLKLFTIDPITGVCPIPAAALPNSMLIGGGVIDSLGGIYAGDDYLLTTGYIAAGCNFAQWIAILGAFTNKGIGFSFWSALGMDVNNFLFTQDTNLTFDLLQPIVPREVFFLYVKTV